MTSNRINSYLDWDVQAQMFTLLNTNLASFLTEANTADTPIRLYGGNSELIAQIASGESLTGVIANSQGLLKVYNTPEGWS